MIFVGMFAAAVVAGLIGSMLGIGGGIMMVPILTLVFGLPIKTAIATSMVCVIATSAAGQLSFVRRRLTNARLGFYLEMGSAAGAVVGGLVAVSADGRVLQACFAAVLLYVVWLTRRRAEGAPPASSGVLEASYVDPVDQRVYTYGARRAGLGLALSVGAGALASLFGVGGGAFKVPTMTLVMGVPLRPAIATSNLMIGVTAAIGAAIFFGHGFVVAEYVVPAALGVLLGAQLGARLVAYLSLRVLGMVFQVVLSVLALLMIAEAVAGGLR